MRPDCHNSVLKLYPWLNELVACAETENDGILTAEALNLFSSLYMQKQAKALYHNSLVILVRILSINDASLVNIDRAFKDINNRSRCLDLCFRYSPDILVLIMSEISQESEPLALISERLHSSVQEYELSHKILAGRASIHEDITKTITRLASTIRL